MCSAVAVAEVELKLELELELDDQANWGGERLYWVTCPVRCLLCAPRWAVARTQLAVAR